MTWFRKAADKGLAMAQCQLGECYLKWISVPQDRAEGIKWLQKAAQQGHEEAKEVLRKITEGSVDSSPESSLIELKGHTEEVHAALFSPDGKKIVTAAHDGAIRIWDALSGKELQKKTVGFVIFVSPNLKKIVALVSGEGSEMLADGDYEYVQIWDTDSGNELKKLERPPDWIFNYALALSPDGKKVVMVGQVRKDNDAIVRTWILE